MTVFVVTGTDTDIGKTVFAAGLAGALDAYYWKPIQAGIDPRGDRETVAALSALPAERILPEAYRLATPASPHLAARIDGVEIALDCLALPRVDGPLVVEGAGGLMVPISEKHLMIDLFAHWGKPVILCARTALGTINHSLLSIEALKTRQVPIAGIAFIGDPHEENERIIPQLAGIRSLGRLPVLNPLTAPALAAAFAQNISLSETFNGR
ncbi:MAG: ATP-dependent dethiobiotin synthetase BioD [Sphingobium sp.]|uniref:dethiobiotin synthase n=1 Tax=Sphingobium sp. TaxID=1912891 RepID=UPI000DB2EF5E|nr:dethiobiotin synthase [Sphingobium sp.]PZU15090.1 MAG: ATP-dependent dethiobiotin synthetase BioD [Sphingobium sp.]